MQGFTMIDLVILVVYLAAVLLAGLHFAKKEMKGKEYFKGDGTVPWWVTSVSIFATLLSPISFLSRVIGAEGAIGGTYGVMPELFLKLNEHVIAGEMEKARELQYAVNEIIYKMCSAHGNMYGVIKAMLKINEGLELGGVREPLPALIESDMAIVEEAAKMVRDAKEKFL